MFPNTPFQNFLESKDACEEARLWVGSQSPEEAWMTCRNGSWMTWLLEIRGVPHRKALATARADFDKALATAWAEYEKATATAEAVYAKALATAEAVYAKAIRELLACPVGEVP
mgnify:CR=1 FL=1